MYKPSVDQQSCSSFFKLNAPKSNVDNVSFYCPKMAMRSNRSPRTRHRLRARKIHFRLPHRTPSKSIGLKKAAIPAVQRVKQYQRSIFDSSADTSDIKNVLAPADDMCACPMVPSMPPKPKPVVSVRRRQQDDQMFASPTTRYTRYISRLTKQMYPGRTMTTSTLGKITLNDFSNAMFECITELAKEMVQATERHTITDWDVQSAVRIILPPGLACDANAFALKSLHVYLQGTKDSS